MRFLSWPFRARTKIRFDLVSRPKYFNYIRSTDLERLPKS